MLHLYIVAETIPSFSAICWIYGMKIQEALGYPIGLIASDWGGTPIEAWSSPDALKKCNMKEMPE